MINYEDLVYEDCAIDFLSDCLRRGTLVLFLGAGTSKGFGLPTWIELVNSLRAEAHLPELIPPVSADKLLGSADLVKRSLRLTDIEFVKLIEKHLYKSFSGLKSLDVFENHLLIAISALLMGNKRGRISKVVTFNFDSMLEWFLSIFGFYAETVYQLPYLEGSEDVIIFHPNGFIPHPELELVHSDFIIFGTDDINERLGTLGDPWFELTRHLLNTGVCLFIGMSPTSFYDRGIAPLILTCSKVNSRPLGIWIVKEEITAETKSDFLDKKIAPIVFLEEKSISEFLLKICNRAMDFPRNN